MTAASAAAVDDEKSLADDVAHADHSPQIDPETERRVRWKQDMRIIPLSASIYFLCYLDRSNIGNAKVLNANTHNDLATETGMTNYQFTIALMMVSSAPCLDSVSAVNPCAVSTRMFDRSRAGKAPCLRIPDRLRILVQLPRRVWSVRGSLQYPAEEVTAVAMDRLSHVRLGGRTYLTACPHTPIGLTFGS